MSDTIDENKGIMQEALLAWKIIRDSDTPFYLKLLPVAAIAYFFFPEVFVGGPLLVTPIDDVAVMFAAMKGVISLAPADVVAKYTGEQSLNYVDGEYSIIDEVDEAAEAPVATEAVDAGADDISSDRSAEKPLTEEIIIDPDKHEW